MTRKFTLPFAAILICLSIQVIAADFCRDLIRASRTNSDAMYNGFIYGYVMGWTRNRDAIATRAVADEVRRLTMKYCAEKPDDDLSSVVGMWTEVVVKSLKR